MNRRPTTRKQASTETAVSSEQSTITTSTTSSSSLASQTRPTDYYSGDKRKKDHSTFIPTLYAIVHYVIEPFRIWDDVGLKEIGTVHELFPDVILCALQGIPAIYLAVELVELQLWIRIIFAMEGMALSTTSVIADGLLFEQYMTIDEITATIYILSLLTLFYNFINCLPVLWSVAIAGMGMINLVFFHSRVHYSSVKRDWMTSRRFARLWHVGGIVVPTIFVTIIKKYIPSCPSSPLLLTSKY